MFYVKSKKGNKYGIMDTTDGVEEFYTKDEISEIIRRVEIVGVTYNSIFPVILYADLCKLVYKGDYSGVLTSMQPNLWFDFVFKSKKPNGLNMIYKYPIAIIRNSKDEYSYYDENRRYRTVNRQEMEDFISYFFKNYALDKFSYVNK